MMLRRLLALLLAGAALPLAAQQLELQDRARGRAVPVTLHAAPGGTACTAVRRCPVALVSPGYGFQPADYSFVSTLLNELGYLVVGVQHQLPGDPELDRKTDVRPQLAAMRERGAANLQFVRVTLGERYPQYDWDRLLLVGGSVGGDISALYAVQHPEQVAAVVTLDNRRGPLPRNAGIGVLSIRADDNEADPGVLPSAAEQAKYGACLVKIAGSRHNDMSDRGSEELKAGIVHTMRQFLLRRECLPGFTLR